MNPMCQINLITTALSEALLHSLWQGLLISVLLALVLKLLSSASAHKRYLAATSALLLQCVLFGASFYYAYQQTEPVARATLEANQTSNFVLTVKQYSKEKDYFNLISSSIETMVTFSRDNHLIISAVWLLGIVLLSFRFAGGLLLVEKLKKSHHKIPEYWRDRMNEMAISMGIHQKIRFVISSKVAVPSITGWLKPVIIMPLSVINLLPPDEIESILAHELAHIKRYDYLVSILQAMVEIMMFFNPFVWWVSNLINEEREYCCDDMAIKAVGNHKTYIYALASLTMYTTAKKVPVGQGVLAATGKKNSVIFRINRIMSKVNKKQNRPHFSVKNLTGGFIAYMFVLAVVSITFIGSGNAQEKEASFTKASFVTTGDFTFKRVTIYETKPQSDSTNEEGKKIEYVFETKDGATFITDEKSMAGKEYKAESIRVIQIDGSEKPMILEERVLGDLNDETEILEEIELDEVSITFPNSGKNMMADSSRIRVVRIEGKANTDSNKKVKANPIYFIDGKRVEHRELKEIDPNNIESVKVLKDASAVKIYGPKAANGVVLIKLKGNVNQVHAKQKTELKGSDDIYYVLDGEAITKDEFESIDPKSIKSINVLKGKYATALYGDLAKGGAVEIFLKKGLTATPPPPPALPELREVSETLLPPPTLLELREVSENKTVVDAFRSGISIYPNPSSDIFNINFKLASDAKVKVSVHGLNGKEVSLLANEDMAAGVHQLSWKAKGMAKGLYLVNILKGEMLYQQKIIIE